MTFTEEFLEDIREAIDRLHVNDIEKLVDFLVEVRDSGRLFIIGSGGGAGHASHAVCDFRKLCNFDALTFENISELTARVNDDGWDSCVVNWMKVGRFNKMDCLMVISVGGGQTEVSQNLSKAILYANEKKARICSIIGKKESFAGTYSDIAIVIDSPNITPVTEGLQAVIWHLLVSHPKLQTQQTKW